MTARNLVLMVAAGLTFTCASSGTRKYPQRRPGCALAVFTSPLPQIQGGWDDIGVAEASCHLDEGDAACLHRLRVEACRMGGDLLYAIPKRASRPAERVMVLRARVAHTVLSPAPEEKEKEKEKQKEDPPPAPASANEPVVPIGAPAPNRDGGAAADAALRARGG